MKYRNQYIEAVRRSNELKLVDARKVLPLATKQMKDKRLKSYFEGSMFFLKDEGVTSAAQLVENCALMHSELSKFLNFNNHPCEVTVGQFYWNKKAFSDYYSLDQLLDELHSPSVGDFLKAHCWLTLPDGSVLDLTILSDLSKINNKPYNRLEENVIHIPPREHDPDHYYVPYLVGRDTLARMKAC